MTGPLDGLLHLPFSCLFGGLLRPPYPFVVSHNRGSKNVLEVQIARPPR